MASYVSCKHERWLSAHIMIIFLQSGQAFTFIKLESQRQTDQAYFVNNFDTTPFTTLKNPSFSSILLPLSWLLLCPPSEQA